MTTLIISRIIISAVTAITFCYCLTIIIIISLISLPAITMIMTAIITATINVRDMKAPNKIVLFTLEYRCKIQLDTLAIYKHTYPHSLYIFNWITDISTRDQLTFWFTFKSISLKHNDMSTRLGRIMWFQLASASLAKSNKWQRRQPCYIFEARAVSWPLTTHICLRRW